MLIAFNYRCMSCKYRGLFDKLFSLFKRHFMIENKLFQPFNDQESRMSFVKVEYFRFNSEQIKRFQSSLAEYYLLLYPEMFVSYIEVVSYASCRNVVLRNVGIEKIQLYFSNINFPNFYPYIMPFYFHRKNKRLTVRVCRLFYSFQIPLVFKVFLLLEPVNSDPLVHVTVGVKQSDTVKRDPCIRSGFKVISRKNSESARIYGHRLVHSEFHGKISYYIIAVSRNIIAVLVSIISFKTHISFKFVVNLIKLVQKTVIF